jgi:hypothetical protein
MWQVDRCVGPFIDAGHRISTSLHCRNILLFIFNGYRNIIKSLTCSSCNG